MRVILYLIGFLIITSVIRSVMRIVAKSMFGEMTPSATQGPRSSAPRASTVGELKKDPVCGTFISTQTAFQKALGSQTYYFCSTQCRDQFKG